MTSKPERCYKSTPLVLALALPALTAAQAPLEQGLRAAGVTVSSRYTDKLQVRSGGRTIGVTTELGSWRIEKVKQDIELPAQGFYIAELVNGSVITVIGGRETVRNSGDLWAVPAGEAMRVRIGGTKQENVLLHIFSIRVGN
jgi:hypothetical protein